MKKLKPQIYEVVYTWVDDGRQEVRYRRPVTDLSLAIEVRNQRRMMRRLGQPRLYSVRRGRC